MGKAKRMSVVAVRRVVGTYMWFSRLLGARSSLGWDEEGLWRTIPSHPFPQSPSAPPVFSEPISTTSIGEEWFPYLRESLASK